MPPENLWQKRAANWLLADLFWTVVFRVEKKRRRGFQNLGDVDKKTGSAKLEIGLTFLQNARSKFPLFHF